MINRVLSLLPALFLMGAAGTLAATGPGAPTGDSAIRRADSAPAAAERPSRPDLVVVIAIDQFPYEYLERFAPYFGKDGFDGFMNGGANYTRALYPYATTYTGPGHAAIGGGHVPADNGVIGNNWFDRRTSRPVYCVEDARAPTLAQGSGMSPMNLTADALGDRLREHSSGSRVYAVAIKDRAAILMGGRKANAAYWFDSKTHSFTSSAYYVPDLALLEAVNAALPDFLEKNATWDLSGAIPAPDLARVTYDPEPSRKFKTDKYGLGLSFPHPVTSFDALMATPFGNDLVLDFARQLIAKERLGRNGAPDILFIGLSSPDYLGHLFGPDSYEVADTVVRTDRQIAAFVGEVERSLKGRVTIGITSDHGVQSIPEIARARGRDAGRIALDNPKKEAKKIADLPAERRQIELAAAAALKLPTTEESPLDDALIEYFEEPSLYLRWSRIAKWGVDSEAARRAVRDAARAIHGVSGAFTNTELLLPARQDATALEIAVRGSFRADRSGDVLVTLSDGYIWNTPGMSTTHGQPVEADQHVILLARGVGVRAGRVDEPVSPTWLARSLGQVLGVDAGEPGGRVLPGFAGTPATPSH